MVTPDTADADLAVEATFFTNQMGWPVRIDGFNRIVMITGPRVDAFRIPTPLAEQVAYRLSVSRAGAPITRDAHWWSFITAPRQNPNRELPHQLSEKQVYAVPSGAR